MDTRTVAAPLPQLRPALGGVSDATPRARELVTKIPQEVRASAPSPQQAPPHFTDSRLRPSPEPQKAVRLFAPAPSSSNGETPHHLSERRGDVTVDSSGHNGFSRPGRQDGCGDVTSVDLSSLPQWTEVVEGSAEVAGTPPSPVVGSVASVSSGAHSLSAAAAPASPEGTAVQHVWTRHVHVDPPSTSLSQPSTGRGAVALSEAAAMMVAQALWRATCLQRCLTRWWDRLESHAQWRLRCECFAEGYYQRNVRYLFFRAWQWRLRHRLQYKAHQREVQELRVHRLQRRVLLAWRARVRQRAQARARADALCVRHSQGLLLRYCAKWRQAATQRALARAVEAASVDTHRADRFQHWLHVALERKRRRLVLSVVQLHTPAAWGCSGGLAVNRAAVALAAGAARPACDDLLRRHVWLQWLRVSMLRRGHRLQHYAAATARIALQAARVLQRARYVRWLRVTFAALQARHEARQLLCRYWGAWAHVGVRRTVGSQHEVMTRLPALQRRCLEHWRGRACRRRAHRKQHETATVFYASVVQAHAVHTALLTWKGRYATRAKQHRMRRVAEGYARPALLRYLFLRHITDGVLAVPILTLDDTEGRSTEALLRAQCSGGAGSLVAAAAVNTAPAQQRGSPSRGARGLRSAIPLSAHEAPHPLPPPPPCLELAERLEKPHVQDDDRQRAAETSTATPQPAILLPPCDVRAEEAVQLPLPPPPSYEAVMRAESTTRGRPGGGRVDIGVGTESGAQSPVETAASSPREAECVGPSGAPHPRVDRCEKGTGTPVSPPVALPMVSAAWQAASSQLPAPHSISFPWTSPWAAPGPMPPSPYRPCVPPSVYGPRWPVWPEVRLPTSRGPYPVQPTPQQDLGLVASSGFLASHGGAHASGVYAGQCAEEPRAHVLPAQYGAHGRSEASLLSTPHSSSRSPCADSPEYPPPSSRSAACGRAADECRIDTDTSAAKAKSSGGARPPSRGPSTAENVAAAGHNVLGHGRVPLRLAAATSAGASRAAYPGCRGDAETTQRCAKPASLPSSRSTSLSREVQPSPQDGVEGLSASPALHFPVPGAAGARPTEVRTHARRVLEDYKTRTRVIGAEKAELHAIEAQLALPIASVGVRAAEALRVRQRYLQQRALEWEQRRAQVAQLAVWLEGRVSAAASAAASSAGAAS